MRTTGTALAAVSAVVAVVACGTSAPPSDPALGIATVSVTETPVRVSIVAYGPGQQVVATVDVARGPFVMSDSFAEDRVGDARRVVGRQLDVRYGDLPLHHESEGLDPLVLPLPPRHGFDAMYSFLVDRRVKSVLDRWGVAFAERAPSVPSSAEIAYTLHSQCGGPCSGGSCPGVANGVGVNCQQVWGGSTNTCSSNGTNSDSCAVVGDDGNSMYPETTWLTQCCTGGAPAKKACRNSSGASTPCGTGGSVGCAVCWNDTGAAGCTTGIATSAPECSNYARVDIDYCFGDDSSCSWSTDCCNSNCVGGTCRPSDWGQCGGPCNNVTDCTYDGTVFCSGGSCLCQI